jgi:hypothetical protein
MYLWLGIPVERLVPQNRMLPPTPGTRQVPDAPSAKVLVYQQAGIAWSLSSPGCNLLNNRYPGLILTEYSY